MLWFVRASLLYNHGVAALAAFSQRVRHHKPASTTREERLGFGGLAQEKEISWKPGAGQY
jgi:hypothetical protein